MASTRLYRTQGTPTNADKWTFSVWVKSTNVDEINEALIMGTYVDSNNYEYVGFNSQKKISYYIKQGGTGVGHLLTDRINKDPASWYHFVYVYDTAASAADRMRIYVNGVEVTAFSTDTQPSLNLDSLINTSGNVINIGTYKDSGAVANEFFQGVMAHAHFCDGQAYAASDFGETDATSGIWVAKTGPSVTYGNNGFFLKFASGALGTDSSGEGNNFTVSGTMTNTKDTPDNNFATWNPLNNYYPAVTFSNANTTLVTASSVYAPSLSTLGMSSGKWYAEFQPTGRVADKNNIIGVSSTEATAAAQELGHFANDWGYEAKPGTGTADLRNNNSSSTYGNTYDDDDIIGVALDVDNLKLYFSKNGVWQNSGDPTSGATGTGAVSITTGPLGNWFFGCTYWTSGGCTFNANFGNGYFGTTAISSGNADDAGEGDFEYDVPAGYYALCTNNLGDQS